MNEEKKSIKINESNVMDGMKWNRISNRNTYKNEEEKWIAMVFVKIYK